MKITQGKNIRVAAGVVAAAMSVAVAALISGQSASAAVLDQGAAQVSGGDVVAQAPESTQPQEYEYREIDGSTQEVTRRTFDQHGKVITTFVTTYKDNSDGVGVPATRTAVSDHYKQVCTMTSTVAGECTITDVNTGIRLNQAQEKAVLRTGVFDAR